MNNRLQIDGDVDSRGLAAVEQLLAGDVIQSAWYGHTTGSTNTLALDELGSANQNVDRPRLILADQQTAGRGRHGRSWVSSAGTLTFSLVIDRPADDRVKQLLPLAVGVGLARSLEFDFAPLRAMLKWPNDVYIGGGKVAGILVETTALAPDQFVIGVGLNVNVTPEMPVLAGNPPACSIAQATGHQLDRYDCLSSVVEHVVHTLAEPDSVIDEFRSRCGLTGKQVRFTHREDDRDGHCLGVSDDGELVVKVDHETIHLRSGEVHLLRVSR